MPKSRDKNVCPPRTVCWCLLNEFPHPSHLLPGSLWTSHHNSSGFFTPPIKFFYQNLLVKISISAVKISYIQRVSHPGVGEPVQLIRCNDPLRPDEVDNPCQVDPLLHHLRLHRPPLLCSHPLQHQISWQARQQTKSLFLWRSEVEVKTKT